MSEPRPVDAILRDLAPTVLAALLRSSSDFATSEDAVQEALIEAAERWPTSGVPHNPAGWLVTAAKRRRIELWRNAASRHQRERRVAATDDARRPTATDEHDTAGTDDSLQLLVLCCHPAISPTSQIALTLRVVAGLTTDEIGRGLLVPTTTVAQRISRAKTAIKQAGARFQAPPTSELEDRLASVRCVLYLIFNEGYLATSGDATDRPELSDEAIRLARLLQRHQPDDGETAGLLALMLLTDARRAARTTADGTLCPLADQDRERWDRALIAEGIAVLTAALQDAPIGPYQLQAAIAALHAEAPAYETTDWKQILALYAHLALVAPGPMVTLNRIVAQSMVSGPRRALASLDAALYANALLAGHPRALSVRAHLLEANGQIDAARTAYEQAARSSLNLQEQRHLLRRAAQADPDRRRPS